MSGDSLVTAIGERPTSEGPMAPKLHPSRLRRSRLASNPMAGLSLNTARGRLVHDTAARLLAGVADPDNPLVIADCIALAELRVRADELRRDPTSDPNVVIKLEGLIDRRMRRLGLDRKREPPSTPDLKTYLAGLKAEVPATASPAMAVPSEREFAETSDVPAETEPSRRLERARVGDVVQVGDHQIEIIDDE